jgi:hypothetical protein
MYLRAVELSGYSIWINYGHIGPARLRDKGK